VTAGLNRILKLHTGAQIISEYDEAGAAMWTLSPDIAQRVLDAFDER
jgi:hypothetical protein